MCVTWMCTRFSFGPIYNSTVLLHDIQSRHSSTCRALRSPRPANTGLRNGARRKLDSRDRISLSSTVHNISIPYACVFLVVYCSCRAI